MPYILKSNRTKVPLNQGQLCYQITKIAQDYLNAGFGESFSSYGEIRNALASAWEVHFLPKLLKYEAKKRKENGDVK